MCLISVARGTSRGSPPTASHPTPCNQQREPQDSGSSAGSGSPHWIWGSLSLLGGYYYRCYFIFIFFKPKRERHAHTKLWDLFNMILANAFCLFFFLGKYLQVASLGATRGCARSGARWKLGTRGWGWGLRAGRHGRHWESAAVLGDRARAPGGGSGEANSPGGSEGGSRAVADWLRGGLRRRLPTFKPSPHALTRRRARTHTLTCRR